MTRGRAPALPLSAHWTPAQALAVFELLEQLRDQLWACYGADIQRAFRDDLDAPDSRQQMFRFDPDSPF